ncbi:MAG: polymer-forming cytoskeletal protein, partial [Phycisphaerales bacterium]|nr:polymer-forming cytoskeletal protein [Phycisphaerales bacterium]
MIIHATHPARSVARQPEKAQAWVPPSFADTPRNKGYRPSHCCVYCGHPVYAPPRVPHVHCPKCYRQISVKDIHLTGTITSDRFITAGKIIVEPNAYVTAELVACHVDLAGEVHGTIL